MIRKAVLYSETKQYSFIIERQPNGKPFMYNGYILKVNKDSIIFKDDLITNEIAILIDSIETLEPSKRRGKQNE